MKIGVKTGLWVWLFFFISGGPACSLSHGGSTQVMPASVEPGLEYLLELCDPETSEQDLDLEKAGVVVDFLRGIPDLADYGPMRREDVNGAFIAFTVNRSLKDILRYAYNQRIPQGAVNPSSINYAYWKEVQGRDDTLPDLWKLADAMSEPLIFRGVSHESITPDLHTGAYYNYDLKRAFLLFRKGPLRVFVSLSDQIGDSEIGKKGYIVGDDEDWNYIYTQEQGIDVMGLGWVKSRIYRFFSMSILIEGADDPGAVKVGVFQWLSAGWAGLNMVNSGHIRNGLERYATQFKGLLESSDLPPPETLERVTSSLSDADEHLLRKGALEVARYIRLKAEVDPSLSSDDLAEKLEDPAYIDGMNRHQLLNMLVKEYIKLRIGKETPLSRSFWQSIRNPSAS